MNKKITWIVTLLALCSHAVAQKAHIKGKISGLQDTDIVFYYLLDGKHKTDTIHTKKGTFSWSPIIPEAQKVSIMFPNQYFEFFAEPKQIKITGSADSLWALQVSGSALQDEADTYEASLQDLTDQENPLYKQWGKGTEDEQRDLEAKIEHIREQKRARGKQYVASHPQSLFSLDLVNQRAMMGAYEEVKPIYDLLHPSIQNTTSGKMLADRLQILKRSTIGESMLLFTQNDQNGKPVNFSDFKGKYVLVDFWASWCGPCRAENPNVLKEYNLYKDKNFTVLGVSLDDNAEKWKKAILDDKMPWTQVSDLKGFDNEVSSYYGIRGIPSTLLVDPQGKIIAKDLRGDSLTQKLKEIFN